MVKKISNSQGGYSVIELIFLSVIVVVLASVLISASSGIRIRERNNTRIADIKTLQLNLEIFYARNGFYPSLSEMNDAHWTAESMKQVPQSDFVDPSSKTNVQLFTTSSTKTNFGYDVSSSSGVTCNNKTVACGQYILTASLEGGSGIFQEKSLN